MKFVIRSSVRLAQLEAQAELILLLLHGGCKLLHGGCNLCWSVVVETWLIVGQSCWSTVVEPWCGSTWLVMVKTGCKWSVESPVTTKDCLGHSQHYRQVDDHYTAPRKNCTTTAQLYVYLVYVNKYRSFSVSLWTKKHVRVCTYMGVSQIGLPLKWSVDHLQTLWGWYGRPPMAWETPMSTNCIYRKKKT